SCFPELRSLQGHSAMCACNLLRGCREEPLPARSGSLTVSAQVGEGLKPADCKSAPPSGVRRFESFPVHQRLFLNRLLVAFVAEVLQTAYGYKRTAGFCGSNSVVESQPSKLLVAASIPVSRSRN